MLKRVGWGGVSFGWHWGQAEAVNGVDWGACRVILMRQGGGRGFWIDPFYPPASVNSPIIHLPHAVVVVVQGVALLRLDALHDDELSCIACMHLWMVNNRCTPLLGHWWACVRLDLTSMCACRCTRRGTRAIHCSRTSCMLPQPIPKRRPPTCLSSRITDLSSASSTTTLQERVRTCEVV